MTDTSAKRKARGAFFTPPEITRFVTEWAVRSAEDRVLEPSAGEADFMLTIGERLSTLGAGFFAGDHLQGIELHTESARRAAERMQEAGFAANIHVQSFFDLPTTPIYDAVVGNPPYIRYHDFTGKMRSQALSVALQHGVRLNGLASSWAAFVVHAAQFLNPHGRLGLVLPAELLSVNYAAEVRRFLLSRFAHVRLVMFEQLVFPGVQEEVVLLLAEGNGPAPFFELYQARGLDELPRLDRAAWMPFTPDEGEKWLQALLPAEALNTYREAFQGEAGFAELQDWGNTYLGIVTGNNRYFTLSRSDVAELGLPERELLRISPPGSRHLRGLTFTDGAWKELASDGKAVYLFQPDAEKPSAAARRYIEAGETTGVHKAYKCRVRKPWWRVPLVPAADLFLTYMDRDRPRLITNRVRAYHLNSLYGVTLRPEHRRLGKDLLPIAALNSLSILGAEIVGRAYGGGLLKIEPREADRMPMPAPALVEAVATELRALRPQLSVALRQGRLQEAVTLVDRVVLTHGIGLAYGELQALREAREVLYGRRITRSGRGNGSD